MAVTGGGQVTSSVGVIARAANSTGTVSVAGAGSTWIVNGLLGVGADATAGTEGGTGVLRIQPGGTVSVTQKIVIGDSVPGDRDQLFLEGGTLSTPEIDFLAAFKPFFWTSGTLHVGTYHGNIIVPNGGVLAPGNSAGATLILGDYSQSAPGAKLDIEIGGTASGSQYDVVNVSGNVILGGNLQLAMLNGFVPNPANTFAILQSTGNFSGAFANAANGQRLFTSDGLGSFIVNYGPGSAFNQQQIVLSSFLTGSLPGDFNHNGVVDAADYVVWRKSDGTPANYNIWRAHFGQTPGSGAGVSANAAVPEPATAVLLIFAAAVRCLKRRRYA
jgi:T5SS/PEP-CTERM-associated repeat protein